MGDSRLRVGENEDGGRLCKEGPGKWSNIWEDPAPENDLCKMNNSSVDRKQKWAMHPRPDHEGLLETINMPGVKSRNFV